ncbi:MAG TPA: hypothetical protein VD908_08550 [Cytophagales bacterium]|nr:hypothetical protein [Cytophagales bacterium]
MVKGLKLDVYQFYLFNYEDWLRLFDEEKKAATANMCEKEKLNFNPYHFEYKETKKIFKKYQHLIIFPDDTLWGAENDKYIFMEYREGLYAFALSYFNRDLSM